MVAQPRRGQPPDELGLDRGRHDGRLVLQAVARPHLVDGDRARQGRVRLDLRQWKSHAPILTRLDSLVPDGTARRRRGRRRTADDGRQHRAGWQRRRVRGPDRAELGHARPDPADPLAATAGDPAVAVRGTRAVRRAAATPGRAVRTGTGTSSTPYGQPPEAAPYGQPPYGQPPQAAPYGQPPYGQTPYGQNPYGQSPYPPPPVPYGAPQQNKGALTLTIVSGVATVMCCLLCLPALIFGIVALTKQSTDPQGSARMTRYGWIAFGICVALAVLLVVVFVALRAFGAFDASTSYDYEGL